MQKHIFEIFLGSLQSKKFIHEKEVRNGSLQTAEASHTSFMKSTNTS